MLSSAFVSRPIARYHLLIGSYKGKQTPCCLLLLCMPAHMQSNSLDACPSSIHAQHSKLGAVLLGSHRRALTITQWAQAAIIIIVGVRPV